MPPRTVRSRPRGLHAPDPWRNAQRGAVPRTPRVFRLRARAPTFLASGLREPRPIPPVRAVWRRFLRLARWSEGERAPLPLPAGVGVPVVVATREGTKGQLTSWWMAGFPVYASDPATVREHPAGRYRFAPGKRCSRLAPL